MGWVKDALEVLRDRRLFVITTLVAVASAAGVTLLAAIGFRVVGETMAQALSRAAVPLRPFDWLLGFGTGADNPGLAERLAVAIGNPYLALFLVWLGTVWLAKAAVAKWMIETYFASYPDWLDPAPVLRAVQDANPFVGRGPELAWLTRMEASEPAWCAVHGMAGVGKTQLALEWALRGVPGRWLVAGVTSLREGNQRPLPRPRKIASWARTHWPRLFGAPLPEDPWDIGVLRPDAMAAWGSRRPRRRTILLLHRPPSDAVPGLLRALAARKPDPQRSLILLWTDALPPEGASLALRCPPLTREEVAEFVVAHGLSADDALLDLLLRESGGIPLVLLWLVDAAHTGRPLHEITAGAALEGQARQWIGQVRSAQQRQDPGGPLCDLLALATAEVMEGLPRAELSQQPWGDEADMRALPPIAAVQDLHPMLPPSMLRAVLPPHPVPLVGTALVALTLAQRPEAAAILARRGWGAAPLAMVRCLRELVQNEAILGQMEAVRAALGAEGLRGAVARMLDPKLAWPDGVGAGFEPWAETCLALAQEGAWSTDLLAPIQAAADEGPTAADRQRLALRALAISARRLVMPDWPGLDAAQARAQTLVARGAGSATAVEVRLQAMRAAWDPDSAEVVRAIEAMRQLLPEVPAAQHPLALTDWTLALAAAARRTAHEDVVRSDAWLGEAQQAWQAWQAWQAQPNVGADATLRVAVPIALREIASSAATLANLPTLPDPARRLVWMEMAFAAMERTAPPDQALCATSATYAASYLVAASGGLPVAARVVLLPRLEVALSLAGPGTGLDAQDNWGRALLNANYAWSRLAAEATEADADLRDGWQQAAEAMLRKLVPLALGASETMRQLTGMAYENTLFALGELVATSPEVEPYKRGVWAERLAALVEEFRRDADPQSLGDQETLSGLLVSYSYAASHMASRGEARDLPRRQAWLDRTQAALAEQRDWHAAQPSSLTIARSFAVTLQNLAFAQCGVASEAPALNTDLREALVEDAFRLRTEAETLFKLPDVTNGVERALARLLQNCGWGASELADNPLLGLSVAKREAWANRCHAVASQIEGLVAASSQPQPLRTIWAASLRAAVFASTGVAATGTALTLARRRHWMDRALDYEGRLRRLMAMPQVEPQWREEWSKALGSLVYGYGRLLAAEGLDAKGREVLMALAFSTTGEIADLAAATTTPEIRLAHATAVKNAAYGAWLLSDPELGVATDRQLHWLGPARRCIDPLRARLSSSMSPKDEPQLIELNWAMAHLEAACLRLGRQAEHDAIRQLRFATARARPHMPDLAREVGV